LTGPANIPSGKDVLGGSFAKSIAHDRDTGLPNEDDHRALYDELEKAELDHDSLINVPQVLFFFFFAWYPWCRSFNFSIKS
jgi:hypothetical protein